MKKLVSFFLILSWWTLAGVPQDGLVAFWALDQSHGLTNMYGGVFNGTAHNGLTVGGTNQLLNPANTATYCNPSGGQYFTLPRTATPSWSLAFWFQTMDYSPSQISVLVGQAGGEGNIGYHNDGFSSNPWLYLFYSGAWHIETNVTWTPTNWHHLAVTYNRGDTDGTYYLDGQFMFTDKASLPGTLYMAVNSSGAAHADAMFSNVALYKRALSSDEVRTIYSDSNGPVILGGLKHLDYRTASTSIPGISISPGVNPDNLVISWTPNPDTVGAWVNRSTVNDPIFSYPIGFSTGTSFTDTTARYGVTYYYWIIGTDGTSLSGFSSGANSSVSLAGPGDVTPTINQLNSVVVTWTSPTNALGSQLWRSLNNDSSTATLLADPAVSPYRDSDVLTNQQYYYWVKSTNSHGVSTFSSPAGVGYLSGLGPLLTVTGPDDWNFFTLSWGDFAPGQQYLVTIRQKNQIRDYIQDLNMGETNCEINNAFWDGTGARIDHTNDWPIFWVTTSDGTKRTQAVQPHWPLVTPPDLSIANCNAATLRGLAPTFKYTPTSHRNSSSIQASNRYYEVPARYVYDLSSLTTYTPVGMSTPDTNVVIYFTADGTSPTLAGGSPSYDGTNGAGVSRLVPSGIIPAFFGAVKGRAFQTNGSGYISPETTLVVDRKLTAIAQCSVAGTIGGPYAISSQAFDSVRFFSDSCDPHQFPSEYRQVYGGNPNNILRACEAYLASHSAVGNMGNLLWSDDVTWSKYVWQDLEICSYIGAHQNLMDIAVTVHDFRKFTQNGLSFSVPGNFTTVPSNILTDVWFGVWNPNTSCGQPYRYAYFGAPNLIGPSGTSAGLVASAAWIQSVACIGNYPFGVFNNSGELGPLGPHTANWSSASYWVLCDIQFTLCDDSHVWGPIN